MKELTPQTTKKPFGFNIIGFATANLGLGVALRNMVALLEQLQYPFCVLDIDPGGNRTGHDGSVLIHSVQAGKPLPFGVNVFFMNPPSVESLFRDLPDLVETKGHMNITVLFWELPSLPTTWKSLLNRMDLILVPSRFIGTAIRTAEIQTPTLFFRQGLSQMPTAVCDRQRWGFPENKTCFMFSFDVSSGVQKKNPLGVLQAFKMAFPSGEAELIFKVNNRTISPEAGLVVDKLKEWITEVQGVRILDQTFAYKDVLSLYASADVFVSLHRGEGLGLGLMESMALGKPTIATGWSGNMDFMDNSNACLIPFTLVPLDEGTQYHAQSHGASQVWADPDLIVAATWMRRLSQSVELREEIGAKARESIRSLQAEISRGEVFSEVRSCYEKMYF